MKKLQLLLMSIALPLMVQSGSALAGDTKWYPFKMNDASSGDLKIVDYMPVDKSEKPHNICVLFPHMKDSFWVAVAYGIAEQSKVLGVNMTIYEAGGYDNLPKQLSQFDDCIASGSNAIVIGAISTVGVAKQLQAAKAKGIPVIAVTNSFISPDLAAGVFVDLKSMASASANALLAGLKPGEAANVVTFPGPAGSGWAETMNKDFETVAGQNSNVKTLASKFGDTGVAVQLQLVQDALQAYPSMNYIWGTAPTAEAAIGALTEAGRSDVKIISSYENQAMLDALKRGDIRAFTTQYPVIEGRVAIDEAVRILDKKPFLRLVQPIPGVIDKASMDKMDMSTVLAPASWSPVYTVKQ
ncbi:TMAO reductase system periplasmic protein TorT [Bradyrhizobium pachyrhizi]|uniref:TMAO reductase system periplasmic protein TorT n=1 Tax=Bradyrhizobium pachyrhizi TaxID=280333 RepID=A0A844SGI3_9BRAD|nr:TMAO reductase system periplasmic protein TorT [Bradyrhizobium pachyrhizi]